MLKHTSTHFLRFVVFILGTIVLLLCIFALPEVFTGGSQELPIVSYALYLIVLGFYATTIPFFIALWQTVKLLRYIDQNTAFSERSIAALRNIKYCAAIIAFFYVCGIPLLYPIAEFEDAPGLIVMGMIISCAPIAVAVFAAVLEKLLQNVVAMKSENDLTV